MMPQLIDKKKNIIIYLLFLFTLSTISGKFVKNENNYFSSINKINIAGLSNADNKKISIELNYLFYQNILSIRKEEIQRVINKYNVIEEYSIKKIYPSTININIKPTKFIARLSSNNQLVGVNGKLIEDKENNKILPNIFGEFNSQYFLNLKKDITKSKFTFEEFKTLYFFPSYRWDILTNDDILIKLPQGNLIESLNFAHKIVSSNDFRNKNLIDLRMDNQLIVK